MKPSVRFYAASERLAAMYRSAAKKNRNLSHRSAISMLSEKSGLRNGSHAVVLSHAEEDCGILSESNAVVSKAFHWLFTEPTTHPDLVTRWSNTTKIHSEQRLHVVRFDDLKAPGIPELLGRICIAFDENGTRGGIVDAYPLGDSLLVRGPLHRMLNIPFDALPSLRGRSRSHRKNFAIDPDGSFLYWPELDVHLGWEQFLQAVEPAELLKARQQTGDFNSRYGLAIRNLRVKAGIAQSQIEGITERQLRRIEHGESRATTHALEALANAHSLTANTYMDRIAKAMT